LRSGSTAHDHWRHLSLQCRPSLLLVTVRPRQCTRALSTRLAVPQPIFTVVSEPRWSIRLDRLSQLDRPLPSRSSTNNDDGVCGARIPIAPAARSPYPSRDFLLWPFAYAGRRYMPHRRHGRHPQTFTETVLSICSKLPAKLTPDLAREPLYLHRSLPLQLAETPQDYVANHIIDGADINY